MQYHYQRGAVLDKKGKSGLKWAFFGFLALVIGGYVGFLALLPSIGGWIFATPDAVAEKIRTVAPGGDGNYLYIPKINIQVIKGGTAARFDGQAAAESKVIASALTVQLTPRQTLEASPFARLDQLADGDEIFIDEDGTRYAFKVTKNQADADLRLYTTDGVLRVMAQRVGIVNWNDGNPTLESL